jgi:hypothetical protein
MNHPRRKDFGDPRGQPPHRAAAEQEAKQDIEKPVWQLMCDVHEEITDNRLGRGTEVNLNQALKRVASLLGRVAWEHERVSKRLLWYTIVIAVLTAVLVWIEFRQALLHH